MLAFIICGVLVGIGAISVSYTHLDVYKRQAVWGFNGTERPGAVYLASVLATHAQKGLPAFGIYGHDVDVYKRQVIRQQLTFLMHIQK